jgi:hypothetical protein
VLTSAFGAGLPEPFLAAGFFGVRVTLGALLVVTVFLQELTPNTL